MEMRTTALARARHMLEGQGRFPGGALPGDISDSWLRSLDLGIDPLARHEKLMLSDTEFKLTQDHHADLVLLDPLLARDVGGRVVAGLGVVVGDVMRPEAGVDALASALRLVAMRSAFCRTISAAACSCSISSLSSSCSASN